MLITKLDFSDQLLVNMLFKFQYFNVGLISNAIDMTLEFTWLNAQNSTTFNASMTLMNNEPLYANVELLQ